MRAVRSILERARPGVGARAGRRPASKGPRRSGRCGGSAGSGCSRPAARRPRCGHRLRPARGRWSPAASPFATRSPGFTSKRMAPARGAAIISMFSNGATTPRKGPGAGQGRVFDDAARHQQPVEAVGVRLGKRAVDIEDAAIFDGGDDQAVEPRLCAGAFDRGGTRLPRRTSRWRRPTAPRPRRPWRRRSPAWPATDGAGT